MPGQSMALCNLRALRGKTVNCQVHKGKKRERTT